MAANRQFSSSSSYTIFSVGCACSMRCTSASSVSVAMYVFHSLIHSVLDGKSLDVLYVMNEFVWCVMLMTIEYFCLSIVPSHELSTFRCISFHGQLACDSLYACILFEQNEALFLSTWGLSFVCFAYSLQICYRICLTNIPWSEWISMSIVRRQ